MMQNKLLAFMVLLQLVGSLVSMSLIEQVLNNPKLKSNHYKRADQADEDYLTDLYNYYDYLIEAAGENLDLNKMRHYLLKKNSHLANNAQNAKAHGPIGGKQEKVLKEKLENFFSPELLNKMMLTMMENGAKNPSYPDTVSSMPIKAKIAEIAKHQHSMADKSPTDSAAPAGNSNQDLIHLFHRFGK